MNNQVEYFNLYKQQLYTLLNHCKNNIPFYCKSWNFVLPPYEFFDYNFFYSQIPILEKTEVRKDSEQFIDKNLNFTNLSIDSTSGTEGKPIICYRSKQERVMCSNSLWKLRRRFVQDIRPSDKFARFYAFRNVNNKIIANEVLYKNNDILLPLFDLCDERLIHYWEKIVEFKPRWLHGPSSTIYNLALVVKKYNLFPYKFEFVECSGEFFQPEHQKCIEEVFQCKAANQYGCREYWPMAYSELDGRLMVETNNIFIEQIENIESESNEYIITLLKNNAWPLVRYRIGDIGNYYFENSRIYLNLYQSRKADFFYLGNNKLYNAIIFSGLSRAICELYGMNVILQFQIIKQNNYNIDVLLRLNQDCNKEEVKKRYKEEILRIVGSNISVNVIETDYIQPDSVTGKTRAFYEIKK